MKNNSTCAKCSGTEVVSMNLRGPLALDFGTFYLGTPVIPELFICLKCGFSETWIVREDDLNDLRKYVKKRDAVV